MKTHALMLLLTCTAMAQVVPHVAFGSAEGGTWRTIILLANQTGGTTGTAQLNFFGPDGAPLSVPVEGVIAASHGVTVTAGGLTALTIENDAEPLAHGWLRVIPGPQMAITGQAILRRSTPGQPDFESVIPMAALPEAVRCLVPLPSSPEPRIEFPFDCSAGYSTTLAMVNLTAAGREFALEVYGGEGSPLLKETIPLAASGKEAFRLDERFPALAGLKGLLRIRASQTELATTALLFNERGTFTTLLPLTQ